MRKPYDSATGLYNYGYRDYRPATARFTTVDPIRDGNNWYSYVNNDPVNWIDLWGLFSDVLEAVLIDRIGEEYVKGDNDCDEWLQSVIDQADGYKMPREWGLASENTVQDHVKNLSELLQSEPSPGANIVLHNNNHAMLGYLNDDGTFDIAHMTSRPSEHLFEGPPPPGNSERLFFNNVEHFKNDWDTANKKTFFVPIDSPSPVPTPATQDNIIQNGSTSDNKNNQTVSKTN